MTSTAARRLATFLIIATGMLCVPLGSAAAVPSPYGSAFVVRSNGATTSWSTSGSAPTVTSLGTGYWRVALPGITGTFGVAHVSTAPGVAAATCALDKVAKHNGAAALWVRCWNLGGTPVNAGFAASYTSVPGGGMGWGTAHQSASATAYTPANAYNWKGLAVTTTPLSEEGGAIMAWKGIAASPSMAVITPVSSSPRACGRATSFFPGPSSDAQVPVACRNSTTDIPADTNHAVHYITTSLFAGAPGISAYGFVVGTTVDAAYSSAGAITVTHPEVGRYVVKVAAGAVPGARLSHVQVAVPSLFGGSRCNSAVTTANGDAKVTVKCWNDSGEPNDAAFTFQYFGAQ